jgi:hypothetical protein
VLGSADSNDLLPEGFEERLGKLPNSMVLGMMRMTSPNLVRQALIDGTQLARLMIRHGVGCRVEETLTIKKLDEEFFE